MFAPLNMTYTKGTFNRYVLDTAYSLAFLLDYTAANSVYGYVDIELDINLLFFKDSFNAFDFCDISFISFKHPATIWSKEVDVHRHENALCDATDDAAIRQSNAVELKIEWFALAEANRIFNHNSIVRTTKLVFLHAAEVGKLRKAALVTARLVSLQAAKASRILQGRICSGEQAKLLQNIPLSTNLYFIIRLIWCFDCLIL